MYFPSVTKYVNLKIELVTFFHNSRNIFSFDVLSLRKNVVFFNSGYYYIYWILYILDIIAMSNTFYDNMT